jgi:hypothetical protein
MASATDGLAIMRAHPAAVAGDIVHAIRRDLAESFVFEVVHLDAFGIALRPIILRFICSHVQKQAFGGLDPVTAKVLDGFAPRQKNAGPAPQGRRAENRGVGWDAALNADAPMQKGQFNSIYTPTH